MLTLSRAEPAAIFPVGARQFRFYWPLLAALALVLSGCVPVTTQTSATDPADPSAKAAAVGYRSTIAPYSSLRPAAPAPWRDRNGAVTPQPTQNR